MCAQEIGFEQGHSFLRLYAPIRGRMLIAVVESLGFLWDTTIPGMTHGKDDLRHRLIAPGGRTVAKEADHYILNSFGGDFGRYASWPVLGAPNPFQIVHRTLHIAQAQRLIARIPACAKLIEPIAVHEVRLDFAGHQHASDCNPNSSHFPFALQCPRSGQRADLRCRAPPPGYRAAAGRLPSGRRLLPVKHFRLSKSCSGADARSMLPTSAKNRLRRRDVAR
jgi:hypothetical protein